MTGSDRGDHPSQSQDTDGQIVLVLVGLIGSGKSTFAQALEQHFPNFRRCNQDDLGNRRKVETLCKKSLEQGLSVCIDRTNFDETQREHFLNIAREYPNVSLWALVFDTPYEMCASRLQTRTNHPTIKSPEMGISVLNRFAADYHTPTADEGFEHILTLLPHPTGDYTHDDISAILDNIKMSPVLTPALSRTSRMQFFRADFSRGGRVRGRSRGNPSHSLSSLKMSGDLDGWRLGPSTLPQTSWRNGVDSRNAGADTNEWRPRRHEE